MQHTRGSSNTITSFISNLGKIKGEGLFLAYQGQRMEPKQGDKTKTDPPTKYIRNALNTEILVRLKDGSQFMGKLVNFDSVMNLILLESKEVDKDGTPHINLGKVMIRGSNIIFVRIAQ
jgi:small nuclear ribonucleoprotein